MTDAKIHNHGSVVGIVPITLAASEWLDEKVQSERYQWMGNVLYVEPRYVEMLVTAMVEDGLTVEM